MNIPIMQYTLGTMIDIQINGEKNTAKVIAFEYAWWKKDWMYHIGIAEYSFGIRIMQEDLIKGINIITNGNTVKVLPINEEAKPK